MAEITTAPQRYPVSLVSHHDEDFVPLEWATSEDVPGKFSMWSYPCDADGTRNDNWGAYTHDHYAFSDPNVAFDFKIRFG